MTVNQQRLVRLKANQAAEAAKLEAEQRLLNGSYMK